MTLKTADVTPAIDPLDPTHSRNEWRWGWTPQTEIWNSRFAMVGFVAYLLWDLAGYSVVRDVLNLMSYSSPVS
ncbi:high light inducible protein [Leptolyngbya sp. FACHB-261]|uniref:high light inducible protein n=1 Tax=Leptolyngbya sp. FACHB-261 TaxID=2692806 RepID=UPI001682CDD3|nr:high light inducible protein [Leptolyngbya sp. FACHB-261]MBD2103151.1 high light inducible protein [Leptolyngbya sp. FACHB-261]